MKGKILAIQTVLAVALSLILTVSQATSAPCPSRWMRYRHHCYRFFSKPASYDKARAYCSCYASSVRKVGDLTDVRSHEEMLFLMGSAHNEIDEAALNGSTPFRVWLDPQTDRAIGKLLQ